MDHMWILWKGLTTNIFLEDVSGHKSLKSINRLQGWGRIGEELCIVVMPTSKSQEP